jgi:L-arabinose isomerase
VKQIWFLTGSQGLYGPETLDQVAGQSQKIATELAEAVPAEVVWKPVLTDADGIHTMMLAANADPDCIGVTAWMHTFSPARMWIAGLDALRKPLLHLHTQANLELPWATIDMDFMNLNQAAHGDREFGYIQARLGVVRKIVAGHVSDPLVACRVAAWARAALGWAEVRSLRLARFGDTMRERRGHRGRPHRGPVAVGGHGQRLRRHRPRRRRARQPGRRGRRAGRRVRRALRGGARTASRRRPARVAALLRTDRAGAARAARGQRARAFTTNFEDLAPCASCPGWPCSGSWPRATASPARATGRPPRCCAR